MKSKKEKTLKSYIQSKTKNDEFRIMYEEVKMHIKKEYNLKKLQKRPGKIQSDIAALKTPISLRVDSSTLADLKTDAHRLGIPYQTLIGSILYRYVNGELIHRK